jgi:biopolymer transport protein ExbB
VADVLSVAIRKWGRPSVEMEQALMDAGERASHGLRRYVRLFNAISTISPLLGLLGTVFGMIHMFNELSVSGTVGRTELFAGGISEALLTTASGLGVAIPALCFYLIFVARVERLLIDIDSAGQELIGIISSEALQEDRQSKLRTKTRTPTAA